MSADKLFKAVVNLTNTPDQIEHIKRLALIFDEVHYIYPQLYCIEDMSLIDPSGNFHVDDFFGNCERYEVLTLPGLQQTLSIFEEAKIAKGISDRDEPLNQLRTELALIDHADPEFCKLIPKSPPGGLRFTVTNVSGPEAGKQRDLVAVSPSVAISDSLILTNTLFLANRESLYPVFLESRHRREMGYRYNQYLGASAQLASAYPNLVSPVNFAAQFGEIAFSIFTDLWSHEMIVNKSAEDVIAYRNDVAPARTKYIASLTELTGMAQENPWNQKTKDQLTKYLLKLASDLEIYRQEANNISRKMFDDLKILSVDAGIKAVTGALTGGLSGTIAPGIPSWGLVLAGALINAARNIPHWYKIRLEAQRAQDEHKKSAVAFIAEFK